MEWITNSKLFKGSKHQAKILAAIADPINKPLVRQLTSYVDPEYVEPKVELDSDKADDSVGDAGSKSPKGSKAPSSGGHSGPHFSAPSGGFDEEISDVDESDVDIDAEPGEVADADANPEPLTDEEPAEVEESTSVRKDVLSSTYVTVETVSHAVNEIPGMLNLRDETKGVVYAKLKSGSDSELWIYYDSDNDVSKVLDGVNLALVESGYYFLEFNRVARDENAIVFVVNWVSNYFNPAQLRGSNAEG